MDSVAANQLARQLTAQQQPICRHVATRLLRAYPELTRSLRLDEGYHAAERLSEVAVERLNELVRSVLLFEVLALADNELNWAGGVLPRRGVTRQHQTAMVRWFFEEVRRLPLTPAEGELSHEVEQYFLGAISNAYERN